MNVGRNGWGAGTKTNSVTGGGGRSKATGARRLERRRLNSWDWRGGRGVSFTTSSSGEFEYYALRTNPKKRLENNNKTNGPFNFQFEARLIRLDFCFFLHFSWGCYVSISRREDVDSFFFLKKTAIWWGNVDGRPRRKRESIRVRLNLRLDEDINRIGRSGASCYQGRRCWLLVETRLGDEGRMNESGVCVCSSCDSGNYQVGRAVVVVWISDAVRLVAAGANGVEDAEMPAMVPSPRPHDARRWFRPASLCGHSGHRPGRP